MGTASVKAPSRRVAKTSDDVAALKFCPKIPRMVAVVVGERPSPDGDVEAASVRKESRAAVPEADARFSRKS